MEIPVFNMAGEEVRRVELPADIFEVEVNVGLMHQALVRQMANARLGTHKTKTRAEVNRSTRKVYKQKGTGNARHGSRKAPIYVGGGIAHGPKPRKYTKQMPRKMRHAALRSALSVKAGNGDIVVLDVLSLEAPKTKEMVGIMNRLVGQHTALLLLAQRDENVEKSARNAQAVKALRASYLNIRDLLGYQKLVMPTTALDFITDFLGQDEWYDGGEEE